MAIKITSDSTCDLAPAQIEEYNRQQAMTSNPRLVEQAENT